MSDTVYDLGDIDRTQNRPRTAVETPPARPRVAYATPSPRSFGRGRAAHGHDGSADWTGALAVGIPGADRFLRGEPALGMLLLSWAGLVGALAWAAWTTRDRLAETLALLGYPPAAAVWTLAALYAAAALVHVVGVLVGRDPDADRGAPHPVVAGIASGLVPGLGQVLNGDRVRAALLLLLLWTVGALWILASAPARALLSEHGLVMPDALAAACSPGVRWIAPAVVWALAIQDAIVRASHRR